MKQVIIRIQKGNRTLHRFYYGTHNSYEYYAHKDVQNNFKPGLTAYIKVGNQAARFFDYEDCEIDLKDYPQDFENINDVIYNKIHDYTLNYYVKDYLPRY